MRGCLDRLCGAVESLLRLRPNLAVHRKAVIALERFHSEQRPVSEVAVRTQCMSVTAGVTEPSQTGLQVLDCFVTCAVSQHAGRGSVYLMGVGTKMRMRHMQQSLCLVVADQRDIQRVVRIAGQRNLVARELRPLPIEEGAAAA